LGSLTALHAIDTNIVIRILLRDDPTQIVLVDKLVSQGNLLITNTVVIETEWVLRAVYRYNCSELSDLFESLLEIDGIRLQDSDGFRWATERYRAGADFTDMMHLLELDDSDCFITFDRKMLRQAGVDCSVPIEILK
jgi:predicted nucleic-acid-binding protein